MSLSLFAAVTGLTQQLAPESYSGGLRPCRIEQASQMPTKANDGGASHVVNGSQMVFGLLNREASRLAIFVWAI